MKERRMRALSESFRESLVNDTMRFWINHAVDREFGGFTNFLDRQGALLCTDKPLWVQGRFSWTMAHLYNTLEKREEWLALARHGIDFITRHGFDTDGRVFYSVTREGRPLRKRRYLIAEIFAILAYAEYARAAHDEQSLSTAKRTLALVRDLSTRPWNAPGALSPKVNPETRPQRGHSMTMILINTLQVMRDCDFSSTPLAYDELIDNQIDEVFSYFVKPDRKALLETVGANGEYDGATPEGRCVNPGHAIETAWFILSEARRRKDQGLAERTLPILDWSLERGWDEKYGGILYFVDVENKQPVQYEWDMKLWWVHNEAIYATLLAFVMTGDSKYEKWFEKILSWSLARFPDREYGEWFGYLHRDGSISHDLKGNMWKGPFHLPRQQLNCHLLLTELLR